MVQQGSANLKLRFTVKYVSGSRLVLQPSWRWIASGNFPAPEVIAMPFVNHEAGATVFNAIPQDSADHPGDMLHQPRRAEQTAGREMTNPAAQEPHESADVVCVAMTDEHIADLMRRAKGHAPGIAKVKQQTAGLMQQPQLQ
jgi:hypothetical protein